MKVAASLLLVTLLCTACATPRDLQTVRFGQQEQADFIVRYYSDDTSYVVKPVKSDGAFLSVLKKDAALDVARQQPARGLAVVILINYPNEDQDVAVKQQWAKSLADAGYQHVVFLRSLGGMRVNGLPVVAHGG